MSGKQSGKKGGGGGNPPGKNRNLVGLTSNIQAPSIVDRTNTPISLNANYFPIIFGDGDKKFYRYSLTFTGATTPLTSRIQRRAIACMIKFHIRESLTNNFVATDYNTLLISRAKIFGEGAIETLATQTPETQSPATQSPATQSPETQTPENQTPQAYSAATQTPETQSPTTQSPTTQRTATQSPAAQKTTAQETIAQSPTAQKAAAQSPTIQSTATQSLASQPPPSQTCTIDFPFWDDDESEPESLAIARRRFTVTIEFKGVVDFQDLLDFIQVPGNNNPYPERNVPIDTLNAIFSRRVNHMAARNASSPSAPEIGCVGKNRFYRIAVRGDSLGGGVEALAGFSRSVCISSQLLLNVNTTTGAFYKGPKLSTLVDEWLLQNDTTANKWPYLSAFLRGVRVKTTYLKTKHSQEPDYNEKIYTIKGMAVRDAPHQALRPDAANIHFPWNQSNSRWDTPVHTYYRKEYPAAAVKTDDLVVDCGSKDKPRYLPVTVLNVLSGQPCRKLTPQHVENMIENAVHPPQEKMARILEQGLMLLGILPVDGVHGPEHCMRVTAGTEMIALTGRLLNPPPILYAGDKKATHNVQRGSWNIQNLKFAKVGEVSSKTYTVIHLVTGNDPYRRENLHASARRLSEAMRVVGMTGWTMYPANSSSNFDRHIVRLQGTHTSFLTQAEETHNEEVILKILGTLKQEGKVSFVLVVLPRKSQNIYASVKRMGDVTLGLRTFCLVANGNSIREHPQYLANVAMKINLKLGGANQWLGAGAGSNGILAKPTMFVGIDVTHPGATSQGGSPSIAAVVATSDTTHYAQWAASVADQRGAKEAVEVVQDLRRLMGERLEYWKSKNKTLPQQIFVYRDGGSDGFFEKIKGEEWTGIKAAIGDKYGLDKAKHPQVVMICVLKRNSTRFFVSSNTPAPQKGTGGNPRAGLFVDSDVTRENRDDFFLQAHDSIKGTAKPVHYVVLENETKHSNQQIATLTYDFCHLFGRATRSIKVHPAIYYADLACDRARVYLRRVYVPFAPGSIYASAAWGNWIWSNDDLKNTMYYV